MRYFSMFTGIGGFEYGIQKAISKAECVGYSEIDKYAIQTYERHFPEHKNYGDATKIKADELPDFDILCGGFPCQAFSIAGKRRGFEDTRGTLFFDVARIIKVKRPKIVFLENVKGLLNHKKGETFRVIIQTLSELGYNVEWMVLNSKFFGVPQNRERVFIIGSVRGTSRPEILPFRRTDTEANQEGIVHPTLTEAIGRQGCSKEYLRSCQTILDINQAQRVYSTEGTSITIKGLGGGQGAKTGLYAVHSLYPRSSKTNQGGTGHLMKQPTNSYCVDTGNMQAVSVRVQGDVDKRKTYLSEEAGTLSANPTSDNLPRTFDGMQIRRLTPTECERLQGFEDNWTEGVSDTQRYKQCGNAVTTKVIKSIMEQLIGGKFTQGATPSFNKDYVQFEVKE